MAANYNVTFSSGTGTFTVNEGTLNSSRTSLDLIGRNYPNYGEVLANDLVHMLENFAQPYPGPSNPITGQVWYDSTNAKLNVRDVYSSSWRPVNGFFQQDDDPSTSISGGNVRDGDLWADTLNKLFYVRFNNKWISIGPNFDTANRTGPYSESIEDRDGAFHEIIKMYINDDVIEILCKEAFTPKIAIDGFSNLVPGKNLSSKKFDSVTPKLNGVSYSAENLKQTIPAVETVSANNFIRNDIDQSTIGMFIVNNDAGIKIGQTTSTFQLLRQNNGQSGVLQNLHEDGNFIFRGFTKNKIFRDVLTVDVGYSQVTVGRVGTTSTNLFVAGASTVTTRLDVLGTGTNVMSVGGGVTIGKNLSVGGQINATTATFTGQIVVNWRDANGNVVTASDGAIIPSVASQYDIGSALMPFRRVHANIVGSTSTTIYGTVSGSATRLTNAVNFSVSGDVVTTEMKSFTGAPGNDITLNVQLKSSAITSKIVNVATTTTDVIPVIAYSTITQMTKAVFLSDINYGFNPLGAVTHPLGSLLPVGTILPYGGATVPHGFVWCDGRRYNRYGPNYSNLYNVIGISYGTTLANDFAVPNLNGADNTGTFALYATTATGAPVNPPPIKYIIKL